MKKNTKSTLAKANRKLAREWHPTRNAPLTPKDVTVGSREKVWWVCKKGHEWESSPFNRNKGRGCHYCAGLKVCDDNCLATLNPKLAREWHPTRNAPLTPKDVTANSNKKAWWVCRKGHEWEACIANRNLGTGCPYCAGHKVCKDNCLRTVNPKLAREWHPTRNAPLTPKDVAPYSQKKVWWVCEKGHEWQAFVKDRSQGNRCPYCAGRKVCKDNCLKTVNPKLAREWHPIRNAPLTPKDVTVCSGKKVWWMCTKGHEWEAVIANRSYGWGCPYCSGRRPTK